MTDSAGATPYFSAMKANLFRWLVVAFSMLSDLGIGAVPTGILVSVGPKEGGPSRVELSGGKEAFYKDSRDVIAGTVTETDGALRIEFPDSKTALVLTPHGGEWLDQDKERWVRRESLLKTDPSWKPVRITVVDQNKKPVKKFGYDYRIERQEGIWDPMLVRPLQAEDGVLSFSCPHECKISLNIDHLDFGRGYGTDRNLDRKAGVKELTAEFERGRTITGKVVADATGKPVAGAEVSPQMFTPPLFTPDRGRSRVTGPDGTFELRGVESGFSVSHADFVEQEVYLDDKDLAKRYAVRLESGQTIRGFVHDPAGKKLAGILVDDGSGKTATTGEDGGFILRGLQKWSNDEWALSFSGEGFNTLDFRRAKIGTAGLDIKLLPLPEFRGSVVSADGTPVKNYRIGCGPGANPSEYECAGQAVDDNNGRFLLRPKSIPKNGTDYWVGIKAEGFAPWDGVVSQSKLSSGDFRAVINVGMTLSASVALPESARGRIEARIEPTDRQGVEKFVQTDYLSRVLASQRIALKPGEKLRIPHLRAGDYKLAIVCMGATPLLRSFHIGNEDLNLGTLRLKGTGAIAGTVNLPYENTKPWRFADGEISIDGVEHQTFKTDEMGRFRVDGVPVGIVTVLFKYNQTADIIGALSRTAKVADGKLTEVRFEGERGAWAQPLRLLFDGQNKIPAYKGIRKVENVTDREPMFRFDVLDVGSGLSACMNSTEWTAGNKSGPVIPDLPPGRWRVQIFDWLGSRGFDRGLRAEVVAEVGEKRTPISLDLGGTALSGRVTTPRNTKRHVQIIAVGKNTKRVFLSRCDRKGDFVVRYLPPDEYILHAHDDEGGWCDLGSFQSKKAVVDCDAHALSVGGNAAGTIAPSLLARKDDVQISALGTDGVEIPVDEIETSGSYRFGQLRPGKWTITVRLDGKEVARHAVEIRTGTTVKLR
jgi:hypothetical protein